MDGLYSRQNRRLFALSMLKSACEKNGCKMLGDCVPSISVFDAALQLSAYSSSSSSTTSRSRNDEIAEIAQIAEVRVDLGFLNRV